MRGAQRSAHSEVLMKSFKNSKIPLTIFKQRLIFTIPDFWWLDMVKRKIAEFRTQMASVRFYAFCRILFYPFLQLSNNLFTA